MRAFTGKTLCKLTGHWYQNNPVARSLLNQPPTDNSGYWIHTYCVRCNKRITRQVTAYPRPDTDPVVSLPEET